MKTRTLYKKRNTLKHSTICTMTSADDEYKKEEGRKERKKTDYY